jgi:hypothetical protein
MKKRTGSVRETIQAEMDGQRIYLLRYKWDSARKSITAEWTPDINRAKVWRYPGMASAWMRARRTTALEPGAQVCNVRHIEGWIEK